MHEIRGMRKTSVFIALFLLIFDFEPQHTEVHFDTIRKMVRYFNQSEDQGKLFINYPRMQSYRHLVSLPDHHFLESKLQYQDFHHYKEIVLNESFNSNVATYDYITFVSLAYHHLCKLLRIQSNTLLVPSLDLYEQIEYIKVFDAQIHAIQKGFVWILNTCIMILVDYQPIHFFEQIEKHSTSFSLPSF